MDAFNERVTHRGEGPKREGLRGSTEAPSSRGPAEQGSGSETVAEVVVQMLRGLGVKQAFGISGAAMARLWAAFSTQLETAHFRHEGGAAFAAAEASFASNRPVVVFTTTGPGITNALTGLLAARDEGAKVILVSAYTAAPQRGRWAIQETSPYTIPTAGFFQPNAMLDFATIVEDPGELPQIARRLAHGMAQPGGFVAHLCIPTNIQRMSEGVSIPQTPLVHAEQVPSDQTLEECARLLSDEPFAIWVGFGAHRASAAVRELAERTGAAVMCSPRGKGAFPEDHPQFIGVTGLAGHASVFAYMKEYQPRRILVLGTRLGEPTSFWSPALVPPKGFIHVDINPMVPGVAYPNVPTFAIRADIGPFVKALLHRLPARDSRKPLPTLMRPDWGEVPAEPSARVRPEALMKAIQRVVVEESQALVMAESGNSFTWATRMLRFSEASRYRVSTGVGAMGHMVTGVVGAAMARGGKAVAIVGDGAMLMNSEISTAAKYQAPAVWLVLNDARYNMCHQGMAMIGLKGADATFPQVDFVAVARGMGASAVRVESESQLDAALRQALAATGPFVVDVLIDPDRIAPSGARNQSLLANASASQKSTPSR